jgi:hypothetical protein
MIHDHPSVNLEPDYNEPLQLNDLNLAVDFFGPINLLITHAFKIDFVWLIHLYINLGMVQLTLEGEKKRETI